MLSTYCVYAADARSICDS